MKSLYVVTIVVAILLVAPTIAGPTLNNVTFQTPKMDSPPSNNNAIKPMQTGGYGNIDVYPFSNSTTGEAIPSDWYNESWKYRVRVSVTENAGLTRDAVPITVHLNFQKGQAMVGTILVLDNKTQKELPYQLWNITYYNSSFYKSLYVTWIGSLNALETRVYYVYWSDVNVSTKATLINDKDHALVPTSESWGHQIENKFYTARLYIGGGISISSGAQQYLTSTSLSPEPYNEITSNATYIWLDSPSMYSGSSGHRDYIKIIPWYDDTVVKIYGYNWTLKEWVKEVDVTVDTTNVLRFPTVGESPYNLTKVESSKTITIIVGDLGSTQQTTYGVDGSSDDDFYTYFGTELVTWVPRDLFITAYFNDTHVKVIDLSDGDDSFDFTLNDGEIWFHGSGDVRTSSQYYRYDTSENLGNPSFFENDIVKIVSDKPITIIGGFLTNDMWGIIKGLNNKKFVFPYFGRFSIGALEDNTQVNVTLKVYNFTTDSFDTFYTDSKILNSQEVQTYDEDPSYYPLVVAVDLYSNASNSPVSFNVTIMEYNDSTYNDWFTYYTYTGTVYPEAESGVSHRNTPNYGNWNETVVWLEGGKTYRVYVCWNTDDNLWLYLYWKGKNPLADGDGDDYETYQGSSSLPSGDLGFNHARSYYIASPIATASTGSPYPYELKHEEWGLAIVESSKPIVVYEILRPNYYEETGTSGYGGEEFGLGKEFNIAIPGSHPYVRYLRIASILNNTHIRVYFNGTNVGWPDNIFRENGELVARVNLIDENNSEITLYQTSSWINIPVPTNTFVKIIADKPILVHLTYYTWNSEFRWNRYSQGGIPYSYPYPDNRTYLFGREEISIFVLDVPQYIVNIEQIVEGPLYTKFRVSWDVRSSVVVKDIYEFWANISYFKVSRIIYTPEYVSFEDQYTFFSGVLVEDFAVESIEVWESPFGTYSYSSTALGGIYANLTGNMVLTYYNSTYGFGLGIESIQAYGSSQVYGAALYTFYNLYTQSINFMMWANKKVYLDGSYANRIEFNYIVTSGAFGTQTSSETVNNLKYENNKPTVVVGDVESTYIDVRVKVYDYDLQPMAQVTVTLTSSAMNYNEQLLTDNTGTAVFSNVPASDDYQIHIYWTNTSLLFTEFPEADRTFGGVTISADSLYEYRIKVRDMVFNIHNVDGEEFPDSSLYLKGVYYYYSGGTQSEMIVETKNFRVNSSRLVLKSMPIDKEEPSSIKLEYYTNFTYTSIYDLTVYNYTEYSWETSNTTNTFDVTMPISTLYVNVLDSNNVSIPGAETFIYYSNRNYSTLANLTGTAVFTNLPTGTYEVNALFYGTMATSNVTVNLQSKTVVNVTLPITYGVKPTKIVLSQEYIEAYWSTEVSISAQILESETNTPLEGNMTIFVVDPVTNTILIQSLMNYDNSSGEPTYTYQFTLDREFKAGKLYTIQVTGFAEGYAKPSAQNATLYVKPIGMVISYPERINVYWGRSAEIMVNVTNTIEFYGTPISDAVVTGVIKKDFTTIESITLPEIAPNTGTYRTQVDIDTKYDIGFYTISITIGKYGYENATISIQLNVMRAPTIATTNTSSVTVIYGENVAIEGIYNRTDETVEGVSGVNATYIIMDTSYNQIVPTSGTFTMTDKGSGKYELSFNSTILNIGSYIIRVSFGSKYHENKTVDVSLTIRAIPTVAIASKTSETLEWGENLTVVVQYNKTIGQYSEAITDADIYTFEVKMGGTTEYSGALTKDPSGYYVLNFNTSLLPSGVGSYIIYISLAKAHHESQTLTIQLTVNSIKVDAIPQPSNMTLVWGTTGQSQITYTRHRDGSVLTADSYSMVLVDLTNGKTVGLDALQLTYDSTNGYYLLIVDAGKLNSSTLYKLIISFTKAHHETIDVEIYIQVEPIPTVAIPSSTLLVTYYGETVDLNVTYQTTGGELISQADVGYQIVSGSTVLYSGTATEIESGIYNIQFNLTEIGLGQGSYRLVVLLEKPNYTAQTLTIDLRVQPRALSVSLFPSAITVTWGDEANLTVYVKDYITGEGLADADIKLFGDPEVVDAAQIIYMGGGEYIIAIDTSQISKTQDFSMNLNVTKENYNSVIEPFKLTVNKVQLEITIKGASNVLLNPITGGTTTYKVGVFDKSRNGAPVTNATLNLQILKGNETVYSVEMKKVEGEPGFYTATINWNNIPNFTPGETYGIRVQLTSVKINQIDVPASMVQPTITSSSVQSTSVDYIGGHAEFPGVGRVPALILYPVLIIVLIIGSVVGYKVVMYMRLPEEVKEIDKLIKLIEKNVYEYETLSREDTIRSLLEEEL
ncbi:MAG: hypothetical protein ACP6IP_01055 [Candidatus Njordarchaeia archaeon]